jgi:hypothetical protein
MAPTPVHTAAQASPMPTAPRMRFSHFFIGNSYLIRSPRLPRRREARGSGGSIGHALLQLLGPVLDEHDAREAPRSRWPVCCWPAGFPTGSRRAAPARPHGIQMSSHTEQATSRALAHSPLRR